MSTYLVRHYMDTSIASTEGNIDVVDAAKQMSTAGKGYLIILDRGHPTGIVTDSDLVKKVLAAEKDPKKVLIKDIMSTPLITTDPDEDLVAASELLKKHDIKQAPAVKGGIIYGVLTTEGISKQFVDYLDRSSRDIMRWCNVLG